MGLIFLLPYSDRVGVGLCAWATPALPTHPTQHKEEGQGQATKQLRIGVSEWVAPTR